MSWTEDVHVTRMAASLAQARRDYRLQRRGYPVTVTPDTHARPFAVMLAAAAGLVWWRTEGRKLRGRDWRQLPVVKQFLMLLEPSGAQSTSMRPRQQRQLSSKLSGSRSTQQQVGIVY